MVHTTTTLKNGRICISYRPIQP